MRREILSFNYHDLCGLGELCGEIKIYLCVLVSWWRKCFATYLYSFPSQCASFFSQVFSPPQQDDVEAEAIEEQEFKEFADGH